MLMHNSFVDVNVSCILCFALAQSMQIEMD